MLLNATESREDEHWVWGTQYSKGHWSLESCFIMVVGKSIRLQGAKDWEGGVKVEGENIGYSLKFGRILFVLFTAVFLAPRKVPGLWQAFNKYSLNDWTKKSRSRKLTWAKVW